MKRTLITAGVLLLSAMTTFANNTPGNNEDRKSRKEARKEARKADRNTVSDFTKGQFYEDFPAATNIRYEKTNYFDEVAFTLNGQRERAYYDIHNQLVGTTERKAFTDIPENAQREIEKKYKDYKIDSVLEYDDNEVNDTDMTMFDTAFDGADNYFVVLRKSSELLIVKVDMAGNVSFFKSMK
ncbi:hypothetical protein [Chitinophaga agri]|uniref:Beta-lactamase-inhibitor-like PepSY-like domain-containing protein n=1 Tax=Chitinophaga agri TaxID=2703787 RepID=A0A6B9ZGU9_9BACT|nr:hypothetical protein [Chitinophaga agri]QHS59823.1 hypothetical protein GWR21_09535 [Chitinophaga agri]